MTHQHTSIFHGYRLYSGLKFALIQAPLARFVSTAANEGVESLLLGIEYTKDWGPGRTTIVASVVVGFWRMFLMRKFIERMRDFVVYLAYCSHHQSTNPRLFT